jgi:hypothetical protein
MGLVFDKSALIKSSQEYLIGDIVLRQTIINDAPYPIFVKQPAPKLKIIAKKSIALKAVVSTSNTAPRRNPKLLPDKA